MRCVFALLILIALLAPAPAWCDQDDDDQDEAREAVERGAISPLAEVLARPELKGAGELVRVRLDREDGRWIYRLRFVDDGGHMKDRQIDATRRTEPQARP